MPNKNYLKGVRKERKLVNEARERGLLSFRSAGSHSPIDVVIVDKEDRRITFVQCKPDSMSRNQRAKIEKEQERLNGFFEVRFEVI